MKMTKRMIYGAIVSGVSLVLLLMLLSAAAFVSYAGFSEGISFFDLFGFVSEIGAGNIGPFMEGLTGLLAIIFLVAMIVYIALGIVIMFVKNKSLDKYMKRAGIDLGASAVLLGIVAIIYGAVNSVEGLTVVSLGGIFYLILGIALIVLHFVFKNKINDALAE